MENIMQKQLEPASLSLRDFRAVPVLLLLQIGSYALLLQGGALYHPGLLPCILLICWLGGTFYFRKGTSILQFIFLFLAVPVVAFLSLLALDVIIPGKGKVSAIIGITLTILCTFAVLLFFRLTKLIRSSPPFLFCLPTWILPAFFFVLFYCANRWGD